MIPGDAGRLRWGAFADSAWRSKGPQSARQEPTKDWHVWTNTEVSLVNSFRLLRGREWDASTRAPDPIGMVRLPSHPALGCANILNMRQLRSVAKGGCYENCVSDVEPIAARYTA